MTRHEIQPNSVTSEAFNFIKISTSSHIAYISKSLFSFQRFTVESSAFVVARLIVDNKEKEFVSMRHLNQVVSKGGSFVEIFHWTSFLSTIDNLLIRDHKTTSHCPLIGALTAQYSQQPSLW